MSSQHTTSQNSSLTGFGRTPASQMSENLQQALRVLDLVPTNASDLTPHPLIVARAEIRNAQRFLRHMINAEHSDSAPHIMA